MQRGVVCIPKSVTPSRIQQNLQVFDFSLSEDDMKLIESFNRNERFIVPAVEVGHWYWPLIRISENILPKQSPWNANYMWMYIQQPSQSKTFFLKVHWWHHMVETSTEFTSWWISDMCRNYSDTVRVWVRHPDLWLSMLQTNPQLCQHIGFCFFFSRGMARECGEMHNILISPSMILTESTQKNAILCYSCHIHLIQIS